MNFLGEIQADGTNWEGRGMSEQVTSSHPLTLTRYREEHGFGASINSIFCCR